MSDFRLTLRMISSELNLNLFAVHEIITQDLNMRKVCAKKFPKNFMNEVYVSWYSEPPWDGARIFVALS